MQNFLTPLEIFFKAVEAGNIDDAISKANAVFTQIDVIRGTKIYKKFLPAFTGLAETAVDIFEDRKWINENGANQIKKALSAFFTTSISTRDWVKGIIEDLTITFTNNPLNAPRVDNMCTGTVIFTTQPTLQLTAPTSGDQARGYVAITTNTGGVREVWLLAGTGLVDFTGEADVGKVEIMTIGKDNILNPASVRGHLWGWNGNMPSYTWDILFEKVIGKVKTSLTDTRKNRITAGLGILQQTVFKTTTANNLLDKLQTALKTRLSYLHNNMGKRVKVNESGYLKGSMLLSGWDELKTLAT
ncbi:MAG: hypothetical protein LBP53_07115 [Candidatus Peribacteria bacterium]|nr:hypothetical protein [Candidatus Peribacteria bacterium]